jgi:hypothetical protein
MIEIFAIIQCMTYSDPHWATANGCWPINMTFSSAEQCKAQAAHLPNTVKSNGDTIEFRCVSKSVQTWKPVE